MKKFLLTAFLGTAFCVAPIVAADIVVHVKPPVLKIEKRPAAPGAGYVWVAGYHRWDGNAYVWVPGEWQKPPREHAVWVAPRWEHRHDGYVFHEGYWK